MKVSKVTSVTEDFDLGKEKKRDVPLPKQKSSRITGYVLAGLTTRQASALLPEVYTFSLIKNIFKVFGTRKKKTLEL